MNGYVARIHQRFADDLRHGTRTAPSFDDAVAPHRVLHAIEKSSDEGVRVEIEALERLWRGAKGMIRGEAGVGRTTA